MPNANPPIGKAQNMTGAGLSSPGPGPWIKKGTTDVTIQAILSGTGTLAAVVDVEVTNDATMPAVATAAAVITLDQTQPSDGCIIQGASWLFLRLHVVSISGTGAKVTGLMGA